MKRFSLLMIASAVAAALAAPTAFAQTGGSTGPSSNDSPRPSERSATDGRSGGTGPFPSQPGGTPGSMQGYGQHHASTVRDVQQALQDKGFEVGPIDGIMGPRTRNALREFQQRQGLRGAGQLNQETLAALNVNTTGSTRPRSSDPSSSPAGASSDRRPGG